MAINYCVYILECNNNNLYTGYTTDMVRRYQEHLEGTGKCKYTRSFRPIKIAQCWLVTGTKADAMQIERYIKTLSKAEKIKLLLAPDQLTTLFSCQRMDEALPT